jgi:hypothetical protein
LSYPLGRFGIVIFHRLRNVVNLLALEDFLFSLFVCKSFFNVDVCLVFSRFSNIIKKVNGIFFLVAKAKLNFEGKVVYMKKKNLLMNFSFKHHRHFYFFSHFFFVASLQHVVVLFEINSCEKEKHEIFSHTGDE